MLNLKREIFVAIERPFRFVELNASFENARTFRFADYTAIVYFSLFIFDICILMFYS